jgi:hypothetical protein
MIIEFCCGRVIFPEVAIEVPDIELLIDQFFILNYIKKYRRNGGYEPHAVRYVCGKCEGRGVYDWVVMIRSGNGVIEKNLRGLGKDPIITMNEDPIKTLFIDIPHRHIYIHYISHLENEPLIYRCDQCQGTGLLTDVKGMIKIKAEDFPNFCYNKLKIIKPKNIKPKNKTSIIGKFLKRLKNII